MDPRSSPELKLFLVSAMHLHIYCLWEHASHAPFFTASKWNEITFICKQFPFIASWSQPAKLHLSFSSLSFLLSFRLPSPSSTSSCCPSSNGTLIKNAAEKQQKVGPAELLFSLIFITGGWGWAHDHETWHSSCGGIEHPRSLDKKQNRGAQGVQEAISA